MTQKKYSIAYWGKMLRDDTPDFKAAMIQTVEKYTKNGGHPQIEWEGPAPFFTAELYWQVYRQSVHDTFYPTPLRTAQLMADWLSVSTGMVVLDPGSGFGALSWAVEQRGGQPLMVEDALQINLLANAAWCDHGLNLIPQLDFLDVKKYQPPPFDAVIVNPPHGKVFGVPYAEAHFLSRIADWAAAGTPVCVILPHGYLNNTRLKVTVEALARYRLVKAQDLPDDTFKPFVKWATTLYLLHVKEDGQYHAQQVYATARGKQTPERRGQAGYSPRPGDEDLALATSRAAARLRGDPLVLHPQGTVDPQRLQELRDRVAARQNYMAVREDEGRGAEIAAMQDTQAADQTRLQAMEQAHADQRTRDNAPAPGSDPAYEDALRLGLSGTSERVRYDTPAAQKIREAMDVIGNVAAARRAACRDQSLRGLKPSGFDWMTDEERTALSRLQLRIIEKSSAEAAADVKRKRAARLAAREPSPSVEKGSMTKTATKTKPVTKKKAAPPKGEGVKVKVTGKVKVAPAKGRPAQPVKKAAPPNPEKNGAGGEGRTTPGPAIDSLAAVHMTAGEARGHLLRLLGLDPARDALLLSNISVELVSQLIKRGLDPKDGPMSASVKTQTMRSLAVTLWCAIAHTPDGEFIEDLYARHIWRELHAVRE